jgi:hypothetical protein
MLMVHSLKQFGLKSTEPFVFVSKDRLLSCYVENILLASRNGDWNSVDRLKLDMQEFIDSLDKGNVRTPKLWQEPSGMGLNETG